MRVRWWGSASVALVVVALAAAGCSSDESGSATDDTTPFRPPTSIDLSPTTGDDDTKADEVDVAEWYKLVGFSDAEVECLLASPLQADVITQLPEQADQPVLIHFEGAERPVVVDPSVTSSVDVERAILTEVGADCAPADKLEALAQADGAAIDESILEVEVPERIEQRRADGATDEELACLDAAFRAAPAKLGSLAANPSAVEVTCVDWVRLGQWRAAALQRGFDGSTATVDERTCLIDTPDDLELLGSVLDVVQLNETLSPEAIDELAPTCVSGTRLNELAFELAVSGVDFGAERLGRG